MASRKSQSPNANKANNIDELNVARDCAIANRCLAFAKSIYFGCSPLLFRVRLLLSSSCSTNGNERYKFAAITWPYQYTIHAPIYVRIYFCAVAKLKNNAVYRQNVILFQEIDSLGPRGNTVIPT